jgi:MoaA/NifB/PqqE/SkfB family radical SAM enzyme
LGIDKRHRKELTLDEIRMISENLGHVNYLSISGGEPSLRDDVPNICKIFYENNDLQSITYHTNGILSLKIRNQINQIIKYCPELNLKVSVSLDGIGKNHDIIRRRKNCFNNVLKTIELLKTLKLKSKINNLRIGINTTYSKFNKNKIENLHSFVKERLSLPHNMSFIRGDVRDSSAKDVNVEDYERIMKSWKNGSDDKLNFHFSIMQSIDKLRPKIIIQTLRQQKQILPCKAGSKTLVISQFGDVYPCEMLNKSFGNVRDYDYNIEKMLFSESGRQIKSFIKEKKCFCTWECVIPLNIIFSIKTYPLLVKEYFSK